ncbi:MFS transporter [Nakamurella flavida]|uniref:MFS transporter n=1 Tax=Nakamurella flavida TaxID=363630 RepID=A0A939C6N2_9ACTN|nr:MFS transporter [Nakamurella flavida]MBM9478289.1 MFS transporter [Nakamurella flavida]MDP9777540.1 MFS family permease [Nakamurella flavida]
MTRPAPASLWRHHGFLRLWGGESTSQFGAQLGQLAIPVLAVTVLGASDLAVGLLGAAATAAFLLVGLPAGAWVDRMAKRRVMLRADLVRALTVAAVPILAVTGVLQIWQLIVVAALVGVATVFFDVAYQSYIPVLVARDQVSEANSKLESTAQLARIGGPAAAGGLLTVLAAPWLLLVTGLTYLVSFLTLSSIRDDEVPAARETRRPLVTEIREGVAFVWRTTLLRRIVACTGVSNLFSTLAMTMLPVLVLRELGLSPAVLGAATAVGSIGGLLGATLTARLTTWIGEGTIIPVSAVVFGLAGLLFAGLTVAPQPLLVPLFVLAEFGLSFAVLVYNIAQVSFRQRICPTPLLGRMNASIRFVVWGVTPIAAVAAGLLSTAFGVSTVIWIGMVGALGAGAFVWFSPLLRMRTLPEAERTG